MGEVEEGIDRTAFKPSPTDFLTLVKGRYLRNISHTPPL